MFPPSFFEQLEDRLNLAVFDTNAEFRMQKSFDTLKISKDELQKQIDAGDKEAGTTDKTTRWEGETLIVDWPATPTTVTEISPSVAIKTTTTTTRQQSMSITGMQSGAFQAKLAEMKQKMIAAQNAGLAKIDAAQTAAAAKVDAAVTGVASKIDSEVSDALHEFAQFTNGAPE